jgi:hypothetical protein
MDCFFNRTNKYRVMDRIIAAQVFVTIAERGSLSGAAELLDMSRAMVTR